MDIVTGLIAFAIMAGIVVLIFLVCREIVCWYWKINEGLTVAKDLLEEQRTTNALLRKAFNIDESPKYIPPMVKSSESY